MDFKPEVDMDAVEHSLHSIETAVHSILLSRSGPDTLSTSPYPIYQIFEPLENLRLRFAAHTSDIETWGGRSRALEMHNHRVGTMWAPGGEESPLPFSVYSSPCEKVHFI